MSYHYSILGHFNNMILGGSIQRFLFGTLDNDYKEYTESLMYNFKSKQVDDLKLIINHTSILKTVMNSARDKQKIAKLIHFRS